MTALGAMYPGLGAIVDRLYGYYNGAETFEWLMTVHPQLGLAPIALIREGRAAEVNAILDRLDEGAYL